MVGSEWLGIMIVCCAIRHKLTWVCWQLTAFTLLVPHEAIPMFVKLRKFSRHSCSRRNQNDIDGHCQIDIISHTSKKRKKKHWSLLAYSPPPPTFHSTWGPGVKDDDGRRIGKSPIRWIILFSPYFSRAGERGD